MDLDQAWTLVELAVQALGRVLMDPPQMLLAIVATAFPLAFFAAVVVMVVVPRRRRRSVGRHHVRPAAGTSPHASRLADLQEAEELPDAPTELAEQIAFEAGWANYPTRPLPIDPAGERPYGTRLRKPDPPSVWQDPRSWT